MRAVAGHDFDRALRALRWPLRELLLAFRELLHEQALAVYRHECLLFMIRQTSSTKRLTPPRRPRFLRVKP